MSATALNGTKWWTDRARHLEAQRARDGPRIAELEAEVALMRAKVEARDATNAAQHAMIGDRDVEIARLRAHLAAAGLALDVLTRPSP